MAKDFTKNARDRSIFLVPSTPVMMNEDQKGQRVETSPFRAARIINIDRIKPNPDQPRKTFHRESLESLAASIKEIGGVIDPLTVEYVEANDCYLIISGERRYRAAKIAGLEKVPCIVKELDDKTRALMQFIANIQREDISPLEEAAAIRQLVQMHGFAQHQIAKLINKSKSYVSQILGLERLSDEARHKVQTSELSKEVQIQASRETDPEKQVQILQMASDDQKTIRQLRAKRRRPGKNRPRQKIEMEGLDEKENVTITEFLEIEAFSHWMWRSEHGRFEVAVRFFDEHPLKDMDKFVWDGLNEAISELKSKLFVNNA
jgi:ParB family transcriptional regulator, chromosome partitioning protein